MFVDSKINPPGVMSEIGRNRKPILKVFSGDTINVEMALFAANGAPAAPDNCIVEFVLSENQFADPIWTGRWWDGIKPVESRPGLVRVSIPSCVSKSLRRGSYMFSARVSDMTGYEFCTQEEGYLLVEYAPTSDQHSIPYRDGTSDNFGNFNSKQKVEEDGYLIDETGAKWEVGVTHVGALTTTPVRHIPSASEYAEKAKEAAKKAKIKEQTS